MWQTGCLHRCFQSPDLLRPKIGGSRLDAAGTLQATINLMPFDGLQQPCPAFFGEAVQRLSMRKVGGVGAGRQVARAGKS